jgi:2,5-diamino-6-(ribosylamino)-4(3H)-pyrimidinone 5'-phosphate reductase
MPTPTPTPTPTPNSPAPTPNPNPTPNSPAPTPNPSPKPILFSMPSTRPYVICHMGPSVDGRIVTSRWKVAPRLMREYNRIHTLLAGDAWIAGRISMADYAAKGKVPPRRSREPLPRGDFIARRAKSYALTIDPKGKIVWGKGQIDDEHVITIITRQVTDAYLAHLREKGVSYVFGGETKVNLPSVLRRLRSKFGIRRLILEGGGGINGTFLNADVIDELSLLVVPVADGSIGTPSLFDARPHRGPARPLRLLSARRLGDIAWLRYRVR